MYLTLGLQHIADFKGYDHILFIITLVAVYVIRDWKKILILITAFTIGHTLTLVLASFNILSISGDWIEFLIPVTIVLTALGNILQKKEQFSKKHHFYKYLLTLFFGLIHGLGFSNYLKSLLGSEDQLVGPLFSFNLGIELGQIIIVSIFLFIGLVFINIIGVKKRDWNIFFSGAGFGIAVILIFERIPF